MRDEWWTLRGVLTLAALIATAVSVIAMWNTIEVNAESRLLNAEARHLRLEAVEARTEAVRVNAEAMRARAAYLRLLNETVKRQTDVWDQLYEQRVSGCGGRQ